MGTDILLEVVDHLFPMVKVLDGEKDGHGEGEKTDQSKDDLEAEAFIKLNSSHRISHLSPLKREKGKETEQISGIQKN
jgi:hypothetical protein